MHLEAERRLLNIERRRVVGHNQGLVRLQKCPVTRYSENLRFATKNSDDLINLAQRSSDHMANLES